jgi:hypothetical protein
MKDVKPGRDPKAKALMILFALLALGAIIGVFISFASLGYIRGELASRGVIRGLWRIFFDNYILGTVIISMNLFLLLGLLGSYIHSFRKTRSSFLLGLVLFLSVLFVQSVLSLPLLNVMLGQTSYQSGLFSILPNMFETIALIILFYLSME